VYVDWGKAREDAAAVPRGVAAGPGGQGQTRKSHPLLGCRMRAQPILPAPLLEALQEYAGMQLLRSSRWDAS
jgi:hypothetical protein